MSRVSIGPNRCAAEQVVTNHGFILSALFLGYGTAAGYGETGPSGSDRMEPEALRWLRFPVTR